MPRYVAILLLLGSVPVNAADRVDFARDVRPLFVKACIGCHGPDKQRGGLRLDRKADALSGGDSGTAIVPGKGAESPLVRLASGSDPDRVMPPKGDRLTVEQVGILRAWIDQGAAWPDDGSETTDPSDWWSLRPLSQPPVPELSAAEAGWARNPIDHFIRTKLRDKKLTPSPEADRRTLIRRLSFDLTGLPPTPKEIEAFSKDPTPDAYEKLVDRLLASPAYGERWARHWLDVVHYGDTHGYDKDKLRPHAYPYRDYVIRALNADKPYARFVQEQIAGDVLFPGTLDGTTALGFIAAGPWDYIGHAEVPETKIDGKIARHLDRDDMVSNTMNTFVSLTVQCAQCHNHKFDPIPQLDYYRLQAVFAALDRADKAYFPDPADAQLVADLTATGDRLRDKVRTSEAKIRELGGKELEELDNKIAAASRGSTTSAEHGYHSGIEMKADSVKWVQVDLGTPTKLTKIVLWGCHDTFNGIGAGFGFPFRFRIEAANDPAFEKSVVVISDQTSVDVPNPGIVPVPLTVDGISARYVRVTATRLAPRRNDYIFALAELEVFDASGKNIAAGRPVTAFDSIESLPRWGRVNLTSEYAPGRATQMTTESIAVLRKQRERLIAKLVDPALVDVLAKARAELARTETELTKHRPTLLVYAGTVHTGSGAFRGTGPDGGKPRTIHLLHRGDVTRPKREVRPAALSGVPGMSAEFSLPPDHPEGARRVALARWLTDPRNPLTWRSIVNRVWQYHFGRGIVATPNDFGRMGEQPTHPELLDWLAVEFRDGGQSLKKLHRLIVTSAAYRQSSASRPEAAAIDVDNAFIWRMTRRKLEAEAIRDSVLLVAGKLDRTMYGPAFQDFAVEQPAHSPHYEYVKHDPNDPKTFRRSIYRFLVRSKPQPFMTALDCADPSIQVPQRNESASPLQALALFNNGFMLTMSEHFAERIKEDPDPVSTAFQLALGRSPTAAERDTLAEYADKHGLANACRVILNLNEFVFVD